MSAIDPQIIKNFLAESVKLTQECLTHLNELERDASRAAEFAVVGNKIDRIMGAARMFDSMDPNVVFALLADDCHSLKKISGYGVHVGKRASLYTETIVFMKDGVQKVQSLLARTDLKLEQIPAAMKVSLKERMAELIKAYDGKPSEETLAQDDIDALFNKK